MVSQTSHVVAKLKKPLYVVEHTDSWVETIFGAVDLGLALWKAHILRIGIEHAADWEGDRMARVYEGVLTNLFGLMVTLDVVDKHTMLIERIIISNASMRTQDGLLLNPPPKAGGKLRGWIMRML